MTNSWFRLYHEFASDLKIQMMSETDQRRYIMLLCLRCCNGDVTLHDEEIVFQLRISAEEWEKTKAVFLQKKLIDCYNRPSAWSKRQFESSSSADRVRKHREKKALEKQLPAAQNVTVTLHKTNSGVTVTPKKQKCSVVDAETETETSTSTRACVRVCAREGAAVDSPSVTSEPLRPEPPPPRDPFSDCDPKLEPEPPPPQQPLPSDPVTSRAIELTALLRKRGASLQASNPKVRGWAESGVTDAEVLTALEAAEKQRAEKSDPTPINAGYLDAIIAGQKRTAAARGASAQPFGSPVLMTRDARIANYVAQKQAIENGAFNDPSHRNEHVIDAESVRIA